jgi:AraC-like DNA-binding protein
MKFAYHQFEPSGRCRPYVEKIWVQESEETPGAAPTTILPNGRIELVIHFGDPFVRLTKSGERTMTADHVVGQQHKPVAIRATGYSGVVIARFHPWGAATLIGQPLTEFGDEFVELSQVWPRQAVGQLLQSVHSSATPRQRAVAVENFIVSQLTDGKPDRACKASIDMMNASWGRHRVSSIAARLGLSRRQLNRRFSKGTGTSPKKMSQILRAQKAITCLRNGWHTHDVVAKCGYADQSHLIHGVIAHAGKRPSEIAGNQGSSLQKQFNAPDVNAFCGQAYL